MLETVVPSLKPTVRGQRGVEPCGEGVMYGRECYAYRAYCHIPKNRPALLTAETCFLGRQHGDKEHIIVAWDGTAFLVLDKAYPGEANKLRSKYKGMTAAQAIAHRKEELRKWDEYEASLPKCRVCGSRGLLRFDDDQPPDVCITCFEKTT